jgi:hypothetical protein
MGLTAIMMSFTSDIASLLGFENYASSFYIFQIAVAAESIARFIETTFDSLLLQGRSQISLFSRTGTRLALLITALALGNTVTLHNLVYIEALAYACGVIVTFALLRRTSTSLRSNTESTVKILPLLKLSAPIYGSQIVGSLIGVDVVKLLVLKTTGTEASAIFGFCASLAWMLQRYLPSFLLAGMIRPLIV